ncbi:Bgt-2956 [Blumeria graminis f. sp. tritici]|uniref:SRR1-like domain-containing protein n=4 Tax=Blumeria graminis TaxID=34373 RepID=A0A656KLP0_BLUGR|nr:hypothetical protein BGT96224_2956 [Blumeria graminis f. sp. tritici 96224]VCU41150.1 Bgt-2956 [Blumeria graminis f. sp. tritici]
MATMKRKQVVDTEGWTHVVRKPRGTGYSKDRRVVRSNTHAGDFEINGVPYLDRTLENLHQEFCHWKKEWEESSACEKLQILLLKRKGSCGMKKVSNIVVLGLGSLLSARRDARRSSGTQLAAVQTILEILGPEIPVVVQDPQYTETDETFLSTRGWRVVKDPQAFDFVCESSLVFAVHCYIEIYKSIASRNKAPAVIIGTKMDNFKRMENSLDMIETALLLDNMVEECEAIDFPQIRYDFSDTKIYWRKKLNSTYSNDK